jgi:hypothetical protein
MIAALLLQMLGLSLTLVGSVILLRSLFVTDDEIDKLSALPIHPSSHYGHGGHCFAALDPEKLNSYKDLYVKNRREDRRKGRCALRLFVVGFILQLVGSVVVTIAA